MMIESMANDIPIIYEDDNFLVVNKPAGISVHRDPFNNNPAITDWLVKKYPKIISVGESSFGPKGEIIEKPGLVHRLDKDTSGVLIVAKNQETFLFFKKQFQNHEIKKTYRAILFGNIKFHTGESERMINLPIGRSARDPRVRVANLKASGRLREAITIYKVLENIGDYCYVEAYPKTGRTHQLRAHFKAINHPIICDKLYSGKLSCPATLDRQALHAFKIRLFLPTGIGKEFEAPMPSDLTKTLENLKQSC